MFRKVLLTLAAVAVVGAAAFTAATFATSPAGAAPFNHRHHVWRPAVRFFAAPAYDSCYVRRVVPTPFGPRAEWINVCY